MTILDGLCSAAVARKHTGTRTQSQLQPSVPPGISSLPVNMAEKVPAGRMCQQQWQGRTCSMSNCAYPYTARGSSCASMLSVYKDSAWEVLPFACMILASTQSACALVHLSFAVETCMRYQGIALLHTLPNDQELYIRSRHQGNHDQRTSVNDHVLHPRTSKSSGASTRRERAGAHFVLDDKEHTAT